jgi:hypothetical protein
MAKRSGAVDARVRNWHMREAKDVEILSAIAMNYTILSILYNFATIPARIDSLRPEGLVAIARRVLDLMAVLRMSGGPPFFIRNPWLNCRSFRPN